MYKTGRECDCPQIKEIKLGNITTNRQTIKEMKELNISPEKTTFDWVCGLFAIIRDITRGIPLVTSVHSKKKKDIAIW